MYRTITAVLVLGWMAMPQPSLAVSQTVTINARVPLSLTQQFLITKNSTVTLHRPLNSPDSVLRVQLAGLGGIPQSSHPLQYAVLNNDRQPLTSHTFTTDQAGNSKQQVILTTLDQPRYLQVWDMAFGEFFLVRELPLTCPQHICYAPFPAGILIVGKISPLEFSNEGQKTTLGATIPSNRSRRILAFTTR